MEEEEEEITWRSGLTEKELLHHDFYEAILWWMSFPPALVLLIGLFLCCCWLRVVEWLAFIVAVGVPAVWIILFSCLYVRFSSYWQEKGSLRLENDKKHYL
jgi:hypothetical protein